MSDKPSPHVDDPFRGRRPTSHERMTGLPWDASYRNGPAPWDVGQPQPAIVRLASRGMFAGGGIVLDVGCGTGENALHLGALGAAVLGVDIAETALAMARQKAGERGIAAEFACADAYQLQRLERQFAVALDCGMFHTCSAEERPRYVASLAAAIERGGVLYVLCFSDTGPEPVPHPVSEAELRTSFQPGSGWNIATIAAERIETRFHDHGAPAWLATIERVE